jgi:glutathione-regulated potassium-efflux system protein KefB
VRAYDRRHTLQLIDKNVDFSVRETFESALVFGRSALETLGIEPERAGAVIDFVRRRDQERLVLQQAGGDAAGIDLLRARMVQEPLSEPEREARPLNAEAEAIIESEAERSSAQ